MKVTVNVEVVDTLVAPVVTVTTQTSGDVEPHPGGDPPKP